MQLLAHLASLVAVASSFEVGLEEEHLSLLQLRASPTHNQTDSQHIVMNHPFGCTGRKTAPRAVSCGIWGDVHQHKKYNGQPAPDFNGNGWFWMAKSKDNTFQAQAFIRIVPGMSVSTASHYAFKFGDKTVFLDRDQNRQSVNEWEFTYYINGELMDPADTPLDEDPFYWVADIRKGQGHPKRALGAKAGSFIPARTSCFESGFASVWTAWVEWIGNTGPYHQWTTMEIETELDFIDENFGQCAGQTIAVQPNEMLVTKEQNDKICRDNQIPQNQCQDPDPPPPPKTKEELCEENGIEMSHAEDLCADQQAHGNDIYEGCLYDVCASNSPEAEENAAAGAEFEANLVNPEAVCVVNAAACEPCDICAAAVNVDLSNVVQNNLGGVGPDTGAEEIRYKNAIDLDGKKVDVVLTAQGEYKTPKPEKNGVTGGGFGRFLMKLKASTDFTFTFQDAETGEPVAVRDLALTFYDLDQAKDSRQRETVSVCGAKEVYTTSDTELEHSTEGVCHSFTSTRKGTGKDNPSNPADITKTQAARSATYEFHSRASISFSARLSRNGMNTRPFLFSFKPVVSCGASDAETTCAQ